LSNGMCQKPPLPGGTFALACELAGGSKVVSAGSCQPSPADFPNKSPWQQRIDACGTAKAGGGCGAGQGCVPQGSGGPTESLCVRQDGMHACPAGWTKSITAYGDATDTRACGACACGAPGTTCSDGTYTFYDLDGCQLGGSDNPITVSSATCTDVSV